MLAAVDGAGRRRVSRSTTTWRCAAPAGRSRRCSRATSRRGDASLRVIGIDPLTAAARRRGASRSAPAPSGCRPSCCRRTSRSPRPRPWRALAGAAGLPPLEADADAAARHPARRHRRRRAAARASRAEVSRLLLPRRRGGARRCRPALAGRLEVRPPAAARRPRAADRQLPPQPDRLRVPELRRRALHRLRGDRPRLRAAPADACARCAPAASPRAASLAARCSPSSSRFALLAGLARRRRRLR